MVRTSLGPLFLFDAEEERIVASRIAFPQRREACSEAINTAQSAESKLTLSQPTLVMS